MQTIDQIKETLPDVQINFQRVRYAPMTCTGRVRGSRRNSFATVVLPEDRPFYGETFQFSWEAIERSIESGSPLRIHAR